MQVFPSKRDPWLVAVIAVDALVSVAVAAFLATIGPAGIVIGLMVVAVGAAFPTALLFTTRYVVDGPTLHVMSGPFRWRIPRADIHSLLPTRTPLASPALSLDRIRINYRLDGEPKSLAVSPADKDAFFRALGFHDQTTTSGAR